jgi:4-amino-4-deoxy-L-arabinose transferase-like glycosyltransferase
MTIANIRPSASHVFAPEDTRGVGFVRWLGRLAVRQYALCALLVLLFAAVNVFVGLNETRIDDSDEARYGVSAYEMVQSRSLVVTTYAGMPEYWNLKPPLGYWLIALSFHLFGVSPLTLRLPAALFALATVALTMAFCRRHLNRRAALAAGLIVATTFGFFSHHGARSGDLDSALTFLLVLAVSLIPCLVEPSALIGFVALLAAGFLLKSFAILPVLLVAGLWLAQTGSWRRLRPATCLAGAALFLAVTGAWAVARWHADGSPYFLQRMVGEDLLARSLREIDKGSSAPWSYVVSLFDRLAPWPLLILGGLFATGATGWGRLRAILGRRGRRVAPLLALWIAVPLVLFSVARTHHHWYMDPVYPALAVAAACSLLAVLRRVPPAWRGTALLACFVLPLVLCEARLLHRVLVRDRMPGSQRFLISLAGRRAELGPELRAALPLRHSERFILEAMDGFRVAEGAGYGPPLGATADMPLLVRKAGAARGIRPDPDDGLLAESDAYSVYGSSNLDLEAARLRLSLPEGRRHLLRSLLRRHHGRLGRGA